MAANVVVCKAGAQRLLYHCSRGADAGISQDNLLFSCCCAHVGWTWRSVCDCFGSSDPPPSHTTDVPEPTDGPWGASAARKRAQVAWGADPKAPTCSKPCLSTALVQKSLYYPAATDLFNNVSYAFPDADIWVR